MSLLLSLRLGEFLLDFLLGESPGQLLEQLHPPLHGELQLVLVDGHEAFGDLLVVLAKKVDGEHDVVNVVENKRALLGVGLLLLDE